MTREGVEEIYQLKKLAADAIEAQSLFLIFIYSKLARIFEGGHAIRNIMAKYGSEISKWLEEEEMVSQLSVKVNEEKLSVIRNQRNWLARSEMA